MNEKLTERNNTFNFKFTIDTDDTLSEEAQEIISKHLLIQFQMSLRKLGVHLPSVIVENEWWQSENQNVGYGGDPQSKKFSQEIRNSLPDSEKESYEGSPLQQFLDDGKKEFIVPIKEIPSFKCNRHQVEKCYRCIKQQQACPRCGCPEVRVKHDHSRKKDVWFLNLTSDGCYVDYCPFCGYCLPELKKEKELKKDED